jgi:hypothetical protein
MPKLSSSSLRKWTLLPLSLIFAAGLLDFGGNIAAAQTTRDGFLWGLATGGIVNGYFMARYAILNPKLGLGMRKVRIGLAVGTAAALVAGTVWLAFFAGYDYPAAPVTFGFALAALVGGWLLLPLLIRPGLAGRLATRPVRVLATVLSVMMAVAFGMFAAHMWDWIVLLAGRVLVGLLLAALLSAVWLVPAYVWGVWRRQSPVDSEAESG